MNKGGILAIIAVIGYIGFELHTMNKARYRMEAPYIYNQLVTANRAVVVCGTPEGEDYEQFLRNIETMRQRTLTELTQLNTDATEQDVLEMVSTRRKDSVRIADEIIDTKGCDDIEVWKLLRRFEIHAKRRLG